MNVDLEFKRIVEALGPLGTWETGSLPESPSGRPVRREFSRRGDGPTVLQEPAQDCGSEQCCSGVGSVCEAHESEPPRHRISPGKLENRVGEELPTGPADRRYAPYPKWDAQTGAWWSWDERRRVWINLGLSAS